MQRASRVHTYINAYTICSTIVKPPPEGRFNEHTTNVGLPSHTVRAFNSHCTAWPICCSTFRPRSASIALPGSYLLCPLLTPVWRSGAISRPSVDRGYRLNFVFPVGRLVSRRCHSISVIPFLSTPYKPPRVMHMTFHA